MGVQENITYDRFPKQSPRVGDRVKVCYNYDTSKTHDGVIVRDDVEEPGVMIIHVPSENRHVLATECMYQFVRGHIQ